MLPQKKYKPSLYDSLTCIYEGIYKVCWIKLLCRSFVCPGFLGECPHLLELADGDPQRAWGKERVEEREGGREGWGTERLRLLHARILHFIAVWSPLCDVGRGDGGIVWGWGLKLRLLSVIYNKSRWLYDHAGHKSSPSTVLTVVSQHHWRGILTLRTEQPFKWPFAELLWAVVV